MFLAALISTIAFSTPVLAGTGDANDTIKEFNKAFRAKKDSYGLRLRAVEELAGDDAEVAEAITKAYATLEKEALGIEKARYKNLEKGKGGSVAKLRKELDPLRDVQRELLIRYETLRTPAALNWMVANVLSDEKLPMRIKLVASRASRNLGDQGAPAFVEALSKAKRPDEQVVILDAVAELGSAARGAGDAVVELLSSESATVREKASWAVARLAIPQGIKPLVELMATERGRTQSRIAASLEVLTRQQHGLTVDAWQRWLADEGDRYVSGAVPLGGGESRILAPPEETYYHGIPQDGHSIVYVIDVSGSMVMSLRNPQMNGDRVVPAAYGEESREQMVKRELIKSLGELPENTLFNIVYYSSVAERFAPKMLLATPANVKRAQKLVESFNSSGATNIYDAVESAFALSGRAAFDRHYECHVDTIFLLTDGKPSLGAQKDDPDTILEGVRRWNPLQRIVVHCIGIGEDTHTDNDFLKQLAEENGGQFVIR